MNYLNAFFAGCGSAFLGVALCGTIMGAHHDYGYIKEGFYNTLQGHSTISTNKNNFIIITMNNDLIFYKNNKLLVDLNKYQGNQSNYWLPQSWGDGLYEEEWSVATSAILNMAVHIPGSLLGALFHEKM